MCALGFIWSVLSAVHVSRFYLQMLLRYCGTKQAFSKLRRLASTITLRKGPTLVLIWHGQSADGSGEMSRISRYTEGSHWCCDYETGDSRCLAGKRKSKEAGSLIAPPFPFLLGQAVVL